MWLRLPLQVAWARDIGLMHLTHSANLASWLVGCVAQQLAQVDDDDVVNKDLFLRTPPTGY
jgi:hypothetical protein